MPSETPLGGRCDAGTFALAAWRQHPAGVGTKWRTGTVAVAGRLAQSSAAIAMPIEGEPWHGRSTGTGMWWPGSLEA